LPYPRPSKACRRSCWKSQDRLGGATTYSLGIVWIGNNHLAPQLGVQDSAEDTAEYLFFLGAGQEDAVQLQAYVDEAPVVLRHFMDKGEIPFYAVPGFPDYYYGIAPGARPEGRNLQVEPFAAPKLGEWLQRMRLSPAATARARFEEIGAWGGRARYAEWDHDLLRQRAENDERTSGGGLAGHMVHSVVSRDIPVMLDTPAGSLIVADGRVVGILVQSKGRPVRIRARKGVVLASGTYNRNYELSRRFDDISSHIAHVPPGQDGDGLVMAMEIGAAVPSKPMFQQMLLYSIPGEEHQGSPLHRTAVNNELGFPHTMVVNADGMRFCDETIGQEVGIGVRYFDNKRHRYINDPCYLVFDQTYLDKYGFANIRPGQPAPEWLTQGKTTRALAEKLGIDPDGLQQTVRRFNRFARAGKDKDYDRGGFSFANSVSGDSTQKPNPNLGPLEKPPYYGVPLVANSTISAGLVTNTYGQVMHVRDRPIPGLYACGSTTFHFYGIGYQAGCQLGGAMVFGHRAVQHAKGG
jgi:3-oxosteroid 1-dehydrogenase